jgi:hypothetical protein
MTTLEEVREWILKDLVAEKELKLDDGFTCSQGVNCFPVDYLILGETP